MKNFARHILKYFLPELDEKPEFVTHYDANKNVIGYTEARAGLIRQNSKAWIQTAQERQKSGSHTAVPILSHHQTQAPLKNTSAKWDGWPDGCFEADFTWEEFEETDKLRCHWSMRTNGGYRNGSVNAETWADAKKTLRRCLGVLDCSNPECKIVHRMPTTTAAYAKAIEKKCRCGAELTQVDCNVTATLLTCKNGVRYINEGFHAHPRPSILLHLLPDEQRRFTNVVIQHPKSKALELLVGPAEMGGPGESVANISPVLCNADRIKKERDKIKKTVGMSGGDSFIEAFAEFDRQHPGFKIFSTIGDVTVISLQSPLMRQQLLKEQLLEGNINGMVNDAAHGWWQHQGALLMVTSTYCLALNCWIPGVVSYTNGASSEHFKYHFLAVLRSIADEAKCRDIVVTDRLFAGMMDFSEAERVGFTSAFVEFWICQPDNTRTEEELKEAAGKLLKGCREHFRAGVTRVSRISAAVPPEMASSFTARALALLDAPSSEEFVERARLIIDEYPDLKSWMKWWTRPVHAAMLFSSERQMDIEIWDSLPDTNNAEEAMHWKLYSACGRNHTFLGGMAALWKMSEYYARLYSAVEIGTRIRYGAAEQWKQTADLIGRTKPSRAHDPAIDKRKRNDGRAPDTSKELLNPKRRKLANDGRPPDTKKALKLNNQAKTPRKSRTSNKQPAKSLGPSSAPALALCSEDSTPAHNSSNIPVVYGPQSWQWSANSCWIDTSLELLYAALVVNSSGLEELYALCEALPKSIDSALLALVSPLISRKAVMLKINQLSANEITTCLNKQRDKLRGDLRRRKIVRGINTYESLWVYISELVRLDTRHESCHRLVQYFQILTFDIHECTGPLEDDSIHSRHVEISSGPMKRKVIHEISEYSARKYKGNVEAYFQDFFAIDKRGAVKKYGCWRVFNGVSWCSGTRKDTSDLVVSIPVVLSVELAPEDTLEDGTAWNIPSHIYPISSAESHQLGLVYDLVGFGVLTNQNTHFFAKYGATGGNDPGTYIYDGMKHNGRPMKLEVDTLDSNIHPDDSLHYIIYYLRGGLTAQDLFVKDRAKELSRCYPLEYKNTDLSSPISIVYNDPDFKLLDPKHRSWMLNPYRDTTSEYITLHTPNKINRPETVIESEDEENNIPAPDEHLPTPPSSLPDSLFSINCRCGVAGDGNLLYDSEMVGEAVQCDDCKDWSHIACQREGRASNLSDNDTFICDYCNLLSHPAFNDPLISQKRKYETRTQLVEKPLSERLIRGCGALARWGEYWYPVRLIHKKNDDQWRVKWWSGCKFGVPGIIAGSVTTVLQEDIVDSLWRLQRERRKIQLGLWTHAHEIPTFDDVLADPSLIPYTEEVNTALEPAKDILYKLLIKPEKTGPRKIPAKKWLRTQKKSLTSIVPFAASLSLLERAMIGNWFEVNICNNDKTLRQYWMTHLPLAHAITIFIAHKMISKIHPSSKGYKITINDLLEKAWDVQTSGTINDLFREVDVDKECLVVFEELLFERSEAAGVAGNRQWGLDIGEHEGFWDPYHGLPEYWNHGDRVEDEEELKVRHLWWEKRLTPWLPTNLSPRTYTDRPQPGPNFVGFEDFLVPVHVLIEQELSKANERPKPRPGIKQQ